MADAFIIVEGGLVQNDPDLPVLDLDVLDAEFVDDDTLDEVENLRDRARQAGAFRVAERAVAWLREHGRGLTCPVCGSAYDLDDGIDWQACPAHTDDIDPMTGEVLAEREDETRIDAGLPYCVADTTINGPAAVLGRFATEDEAAAFIETLPEYLSGRYGLDGPADD